MPTSEIDEFSTSLFEEGKRFLELAKEADNEISRNAFLHASLLVSFSSLEAFINSICDDMTLAENLTPHEIGILKETEVIFKNGEFVQTDRLKIHRLEERIMFLIHRFSKKGYSPENDWMSRLRSATKTRNELTHPKAKPNISITSVEQALEAILDTLEAVYRSVFKAGFPGKGRGLTAKLNF